jgi:hypothetical protein
MKMPMGAGRVVARSYIAFALGWLELFTWGYGGRSGGVPSMEHGTDSSMGVYGYWSENHLIVKKITNNVIS